MVSYDERDLGSHSEFEQRWRFSETAPFQRPNRSRDWILALAEDRGREVATIGWALRSPYRKVNVERFSVVSEVSLYDLEYERYGREWLLQLGLDELETVYVSWGTSSSVVTQWRTFCAHWDDFWDVFDTVNVFDDTLSWGVLLGPEQWGVFVRETASGPQTGLASRGEGLVAFDHTNPLHNR